MEEQFKDVFIENLIKEVGYLKADTIYKETLIAGLQKEIQLLTDALENERLQNSVEVEEEYDRCFVCE